MTSAQHILTMDQVTVDSDRSYDSGLWNFSLELKPGEMALIRLERSNVRIPLADAAQGLIEPSSGIVRFHNEDWQEMSADRAAACRGRIGRVFEGPSWINTMDLGENIMLAQYHHTRRPAAQITEEAIGLANLFGLPGLPRSTPWQAHSQDLQRAACARAFMGQPELIILERPTAGLYPEIMSPLMSAIRKARIAGAAVVWTTSEPEIWTDNGIRATHKLLMSGSQAFAAAR